MNNKEITKKYLKNIYPRGDFSQMCESQYEEWLESKKTFQKVFLNGNSKISFKVDLEDVSIDLMKKIDSLFKKYVMEIDDDLYYSLMRVFKQFERVTMKHNKTFSSIIRENKLIEDIHITRAKDLFTFRKNTKLTKLIIQLLTPLLLPKTIESIINEYSMIIQEVSRKKETMWISTRPEDIITLSENSLGWSSCMATTKSYIYKLGLIEYMASPRVAVAYLKSNTRDLEGNIDNKKWRVLIIVSIVNKKMLVQIQKPYPFFSPDLVNAIQNYLLNQENVKEEIGHQMIPQIETKYAYLDAPYQNFFCTVIDNKSVKDFDKEITYECPICGSNEPCDCFADVIKCECCEEIVPREDTREVDGQHICEQCLDEYYGFCETCQEWHALEDIEVVFDDPICSSCLEANYVMCKNCGEYVEIDDVDINGICSYCQDY